MRQLAIEPVISRSGAYVLADAGTVNRNFAPIIVDPPPTPLKLPVGTIVHFAGSLEEAAKMKPVGWWPCDGSVVNDQLAREWNGKPTPNLIGRFLRSVAADKIGSFGGSETHKHQFSSRTGYETEGTWKGPEGADNSSGKNWNHKHDYSGTTSEGSNLPSYFTVASCSR